MNRTYKTILSFFVIIAGLGAQPHKPRLVLAIIVDQLRADYLVRYRPDFNSGFERLLKTGAVYSDAQYLHAHTVTAVGHSTFLSGATPSVSGIIANEWFDREIGRSIASIFDPKATAVGGIPGAASASPRRLLVSTVGDELKMQGSESKVLGISFKDRSAILPAGHMADAAYWYDPDTSRWITSSYYRAELPEWVKKVNDEHPYQKFIGARWLPFDATSDSATPFCTMVAGTEIRYCGGLEATPWGNMLLEDLAERAIANEDLGKHAGTDVLTISFSANDYVGHAVGPDDPAIRDITIRTDRLLGRLFDFVDQRVGLANTLIVLTADHGVAPVPEVNQARRMPGGRLSETRIANKITEALTKRFGSGKWLASAAAPMMYLNLELIETRKLDLAEVERVAAAAARSEDHIARVYTSRDLASGNVQQDGIGRAFSLNFYGPRSGNIFILPEPYFLFDGTGTTHGTPYGYDTHVPLIFAGAGIQAGTYAREVAINDIAPTVAMLLHVPTPSGSRGHILSEVLR